MGEAREHKDPSYNTHRMSALPKSDPAPQFKIGDHVIVARKGADENMTGVVVMVWVKNGRYLVEFNHVDQQQYREQDLAADPKVAASTPVS